VFGVLIRTKDPHAVRLRSKDCLSVSAEGQMKEQGLFLLFAAGSFISLMMRLSGLRW